MDGFTSGAGKYETPDAGAGEVQRVFGLQGEVEPREAQGGLGGGDRGGEEGWDWDIDSGRKWAGHGLGRRLVGGKGGEGDGDFCSSIPLEFV